MILTHSQQQARDRAVQVLDHYVTMALQKAGGHVDRDTHVEIESIIDDIILAATPPAPGSTLHAETVQQVSGPDPRD